MAGSDSNAGDDPRSRAKQRLERAAQHTEEYLDELKTLTDDAASLTRELLNPKGKSVAQLFGNFVALTINAGAPLYGCLESYQGKPLESNPGGSKPGGQDVVATAADELVLSFDIRSEMAGPVLWKFPSKGMRAVGKTGLKGSGGQIDANHLVIRPVADDTMIIVSLRDLHKEGIPAVGTYSGAIVLEDAKKKRTRLSLRAVCTGELWWDP